MSPTHRIIIQSSPKRHTYSLSSSWQINPASLTVSSAVSYARVANSSIASTTIASQPIVPSISKVSQLLIKPAVTLLSPTVTLSQLNVTLPTSISHPVIFPTLLKPCTTLSDRTDLSFTFYYQNMRSTSNNDKDFWTLLVFSAMHL